MTRQMLFRESLLRRSGLRLPLLSQKGNAYEPMHLGN